MTAGSGTQISARVSPGHQGCASSGSQPPRKERLPAPNCPGHSLPFPTDGEHPCRSHRTHAMSSLRRVPDNPLPRVQGSGNTQAYKDMRSQKRTFAKAPAITEDPRLPSAVLLGSETVMLSVRLPGLYLQGPGWPQSLQATCPQ